MTRAVIYNNNVIFDIAECDFYGFTITIRSAYNGRSQGLISIDLYDDEITLYKWFDEGKFPNFFDLVQGNDGRRRLQVIGVDDII